MTGKSPSPADNRPKAEHGQETTRDALLLAAAEVYARRGYQRMTMENVLEQAGLSRPTLYKYFSNKHDLVSAALLLQATHLYQSMVAAIPAGTAPVTELMRTWLQAYYHWSESHRPLCQQILRELDDPESPVAQARATFMGLVQALWTQELAANGLQPADPLEIDALFHVMEHLAIRYFSLPAEEQNAEQRQRFIDNSMTLAGAYIMLLDQQRPTRAGTPRSPD